MYDIYLSSHDDTRRYLLGKSGARPLIAVGLNPSTATRERADPTVAKVEGVAKRCGYDGFVMLNLYPVRATHFETLPHQADDAAWRENIDRIVCTLAGLPEAHIWAAWGQSILARDFFVAACAEIARRTSGLGFHWFHFGELTKGGHPRHPSRLDYRWQFAAFDIAGYAQPLLTARR